MAIEFDCPSCSSTIRVPDAYGGKQGRCPKCDTRLLVPTVLRPEHVTAPAQPVAANTESTSSPTVDFPVAESFSVQTSSKTNRKRSARRRPSRALVVGMPVLGFLILLAIIGFAVTGSLPELNGELVASRIEAPSLPKVTIPWSDTGLSEDERTTLRDFLTTTPETLSSQVMTCRLIGADAGIEVQLTAEADHEWCMVETSTNKPLALWLKRERSALNMKRIQIFREALTTYCRDKLTQIAGEPISINVMSVRNDIGINACGDALSFVTEATIGNKQIPCSYEDDTGNIYFCVPRGTTSFDVHGRTLADGSKPFAGKYTATAAGISRPPVELNAADKPAAKDANSEQMPDTSEETDATKTQSEASGEPGEKMKDDSSPESDSMDKPAMKKPSMEMGMDPKLEMESEMPMKMDEKSPPAKGKRLFEDEDTMHEDTMPKEKSSGLKT